MGGGGRPPKSTTYFDAAPKQYDEIESIISFLGAELLVF